MTPKINPFEVPNWAGRRPLCPWQDPGHLDYYVDVDNTRQVRDKFTGVMRDLTALTRDGLLVLVTGDARCGKSSIVNWCAHHALERMKAENLRPQLIDLRRTFDGETDELELTVRRQRVSDRLVSELLNKALVLSDQRQDLAADRDHADRVFLTLPGRLNTENADSLVILLPDTEIPSEVIKYSSLARERMLIIVESRWYLDDQVRKVVDGASIPPVVLEVGALKEGDAQRFVNARFKKSSVQGTYPALEADTVKKAAKWWNTIGYLNATLYGTYDWKLREEDAYDATGVVSYEHILEYMYMATGTTSGSGTTRTDRGAHE
jgi:hypothetical protein